MMGSTLFQGEIIRKLLKCIDDLKKIFLSRTTGPISAKLGTNHPWVKGVLEYSKEEPLLFRRGDDYELVKIHRQNFKIFFYKTTGPISSIISKKYPWVKRIEFVQMERPYLFTLVNLLLLNYWATFIIYIIRISLKCIHWFEQVSQESDVAHGPLVLFQRIFHHLWWKWDWLQIWQKTLI